MSRTRLLGVGGIYGEPLRWQGLWSGADGVAKGISNADMKEPDIWEPLRGMAR